MKNGYTDGRQDWFLKLAEEYFDLDDVIRGLQARQNEIKDAFKYSTREGETFSVNGRTIYWEGAVRRTVSTDLAKRYLSEEMIRKITKVSSFKRIKVADNRR